MRPFHQEKHPYQPHPDMPIHSAHTDVTVARGWQRGGDETLHMPGLAVEAKRRDKWLVFVRDRARSDMSESRSDFLEMAVCELYCLDSVPLGGYPLSLRLFTRDPQPSRSLNRVRPGRQ
jgi:hypothetical protein